MRSHRAEAIEKGTSVDICRRKTPVDPSKIYPAKVLLENEKKKNKRKKKKERREKKKEEEKKLVRENSNRRQTDMTCQVWVDRRAKWYVLLSLSFAPSMWTFTGIKKNVHREVLGAGATRKKHARELGEITGGDKGAKKKGGSKWKKSERNLKPFSLPVFSNFSSRARVILLPAPLLVFPLFPLAA